MKLRVIEDGNGDFRLQEKRYDFHLGEQWETLQGSFETEDRAVAYVTGLIKENQRNRRAKETKRVIQEFDL